MSFVQRRIVTPVLDGSNRGKAITQFKQRRERVTKAARHRILKQNQQAISRVRNPTEVLDRHLGTQLASQRQRLRRKDQQAVSSADSGHLCDPGRFKTAAGEHAHNNGQRVPQFVLCQLQSQPLLVDGQRVNFGSVPVDRDCRDPVHRSEIAKMASKRDSVDREITVKRHQTGGDDPCWLER